jgi:hypothetical protein
MAEQSFIHDGYQHWADRICNGPRDYLFEEKQYGTQIFKGRFKAGGTRNEKAKKRYAKKRAQWQKGQEPQASHSYRSLGSAQERKESTP